MLGINIMQSLKPVRHSQRANYNAEQNLNAKKQIKAQNSISFTSNADEITSKYDKTDFSMSKRANEIVKKYCNFEDVTVCSGTTQYYDTREAELYRLLKNEYKSGNKDVIRLTLAKLNFIGPVGYLNDTYANVKLPVFAKADSKEYLNKDSLEIFENFAETEEREISGGAEKYKKERLKTSLKNRIFRLATRKDAQDKLSKYKEELKFFVRKFLLAEKGLGCLPNCVLFVDNNPEAVYECVNWMKKMLPSANFVFVEGKKSDLNDYRQQFEDELENIKYENIGTKKRSILFIPHLDDLADTRKNSMEDIAQLKYLTQIADTEYNTTIIFYTTPEKMPYLDKGITKSNRIGLVLSSQGE